MIFIFMVFIPIVILKNCKYKLFKNQMISQQCFYEVIVWIYLLYLVYMYEKSNST